MKLFFKKSGEGSPLIILHGLFGLGDNWNTLSKAYGESGFGCYVVDQRNHGRSPHSDVFNFRVMAEDILELMDDEKIGRADLIGHSMGGKTAMFLAQAHPERVVKMVVADIAPRYYAPHHQTILSALQSLDLDFVSSRKEAEEALRISIHDEPTLQFLLKNLYWKDTNKLAWRFNLPVLVRDIDAVSERVPSAPRIQTPTLFLRGEKSGYISEIDEQDIRELFTDVRIVTIRNSGHWIHAEQPEEFLRQTLLFLKTPAG